MNKEETKKNIVVVLVVLALFLGYMIYEKSPLKISSSESSDLNIDTKIDSEGFTLDEKKLLSVPEAGASQEQIDEHYKLAEKLAFVGNEVEVKDCKVNHLVVKVNLNSGVKFKNTSDRKLTISFDDNNYLDIDAGKTVSTTKVFVHGLGLYGYLCKQDGFTGLVGFVLVVPK